MGSCATIQLIQPKLKPHAIVQNVHCPPIYMCTVESWFLEHASKENTNWFEESGVWNIGGKITAKQIQWKRLLVQVIWEIEGSGNRDSSELWTVCDQLHKQFSSYYMYFRYQDCGMWFPRLPQVILIQQQDTCSRLTDKVRCIMSRITFTIK